jgi:hypothetical protein
MSVRFHCAASQHGPQQRRCRQCRCKSGAQAVHSSTVGGRMGKKIYEDLGLGTGPELVEAWPGAQREDGGSAGGSAAAECWHSAASAGASAAT